MASVEGRRNSRLRRIAIWLTGVGLGAWGFVGTRDAFDGALPLYAFKVAAYMGTALVVVAIGVDVFRRFSERDHFRRLFRAVRVKRPDLAVVRSLSAEFVPDVPSMDLLDQIYNSNNSCIWFVERSKESSFSRSAQRIGFFSIIPVTREAATLLSRNRLTAFQFDRAHVSAPKKKPVALYVGGLGVSGFRARGWLVDYVKCRIDKAFEDGIKVVYTRPVTDDGLRLANQLKFEPAVPSEPGVTNVYKLEAPDS